MCTNNRWILRHLAWMLAATVVLTMTQVAVAVGNPADEEPWASAVPLTINQTYHLRTGYENEWDFFSFQVVEGRVYSFVIDHQGAGRTPTRLVVNDGESGAYLQSSSYSSEGHPWLTWVAPKSGTFFAQAAGSEVGDYDLTIRDAGKAAITGSAIATGSYPGVDPSTNPWGQWIGRMSSVQLMTVTSEGLQPSGVEIWTDDWGRFAFPVVDDGVYAVRLCKSPFYNECTSAPFTVAAGAAPKVSISVPILPPSIAGRLVDSATGAPVTTAFVVANRRDEQTGLLVNYWYSRRGWNGEYAFWLENGEYKFGVRELTWGDKTVWWPASNTPEGGTLVQVSRGKTVKADFRVAAGESVVGYGKSAVLESRIGDSTDVLLAKTSATVERWDSGSKKWVKVGTADPGTVIGTYRYSVRPSVRTVYRMRAAKGNSRYSTPGRVVSPKARVGTPVAPAKMSSKRSYRVYGSLKPRHRSSTRPVRIYRWRKTASGVWESRGYVKATAYDYKSYSRYSAKLRLSARGKWRLRAYAPRDSRHAASWSGGYDYVTVR